MSEHEHTDQQTEPLADQQTEPLADQQTDQQTELLADQQTELLAPPAWGMEFPPEQPRRDAPDPSLAGMPTAASVAAASAIGEEADADFTHEDRRPLDRRRRRARAIDSLIMAPVAFLILKMTGGLTAAAGLLILAVELSYFFVFESLQGQTIGKRMNALRVVRPDGGAAGTGKIAVRTFLRPLDYMLVGIVTVMATGTKRQRLGDLAAGTIVRDDSRIFQRAPESPLLVVVPLLMVGLAVAGMVALKPGDPMLADRSDHPYMAKIDTICEKRVRQERALDQTGQLNLISDRVLRRQEERKIAKLSAPPADVKADVAEVRRHQRKVNAALERMKRDIDRSPGDPNVVAQQHSPAVEGLMAAAAERYKELGLPYCAS